MAVRKSTGTAAYEAAAQHIALRGGREHVARRDGIPVRVEADQRRLHPEARVEFVGKGVDPHRKAGRVIRPNQEADAPYVDGVIHGDGLTSSQDRGRLCRVPPDRTDDQGSRRHSTGAERADLHLFRRQEREPFTSASVADVPLGDDVLVGLGLCAHNPDVTERAVFRDVRISGRPSTPVLYRDFIGSVLERLDIGTGHREQLLQSDQPIEAPNWTRDRAALIYNRGGRAPGWGGLYRFDLATRE